MLHFNKYKNTYNGTYICFCYVISKLISYAVLPAVVGLPLNPLGKSAIIHGLLCTHLCEVIHWLMVLQLLFFFCLFFITENHNCQASSSPNTCMCV